MDRIKTRGTAISTGMGATKLNPQLDNGGQTLFETYRLQFQQQVRRITGMTRRSYGLRGRSARTAMHSIRNREKRIYHQLSTTLTLHFGELHLQQLFQVQLMSRKQKVGETFQNFETDVRRLMHTTSISPSGYCHARFS